MKKILLSVFLLASSTGLFSQTIDGGGYHSLSVCTDGTVRSWGLNASGQLGDGTTTQQASPVTVSSLTGVTAVSAGYYHSLALRNDGTVWGWGQNSNNQLGDGSATQRNTPVQTNLLTGVIATAAGS